MDRAPIVMSEPPILQVVRKEYFTHYGDTIERLFDAELWQKDPTIHKFQVRSTKEIFYCVDTADPEEAYRGYIEKAPKIITQDDVVERLPFDFGEARGSYVDTFSLRCDPVPHQPCRYKSQKYGKEFRTRSLDIFESYQYFLEDPQRRGY